MQFDPNRDYPLGVRRPELVRTPTGTLLEEVTLDAAREGRLAGAELRATPDTLRLQAAVARASGRSQLAENLERAAEIAGLPDEELLEIYTALRPRRSTARELESWARRLDEQEAPRTAAFVREAAGVYARRNLLAV
jgi:propanediol dehydratase small subunit